ncbi:LacI family DNA-binding transcriptional regulator [Nocardia sp. NPDC127579]|uniref:LacI family DNA-binding transcriptional regulator n=1 Tax=Nocardia sp. NPDC127579 TaxID=3345402 RepID=UPI00363A3591
MSPKRVRMSDIAAHVGNVSIATVSRALRDEPGVSPGVRERIRKAAAELAYPIAIETTGRVAVVTPVVETWFYSSVVAGIHDQLRAAGLDLLLHCLDTAARRHEFFRGLAARRTVDAVIIIAAPLTEADREQLTRSGLPVLGVGAHAEGLPSVGFRDVDAAERAVRHLTDLGHERIAMIRTQSLEGGNWDADVDRHTGYRNELARAGIAERDEYVTTVPWGIAEGAEAMERLLGLATPPTAVFCHSDEIAAGALRTLRLGAQLSIPGSMSVVAIDNHPIAEMLDLTTVEQPAREQGRRAAAAIADHLRDGTPLPTEALRADRIVYRRTTAAPGATGTPTASSAEV